jgi:tellurite resistance protein TehA-like permease
MKSNHALIGIALFCLVVAVVSSAVIWAEVPSPVKIGMFAFGFGPGVAVGTLIARRARGSRTA